MSTLYYPTEFGDSATELWNGNIWYPSPSVFQGHSQETFVQEAHPKRQRVAPTPYLDGEGRPLEISW